MVNEHYNSALEMMCVPQFFFFVCAWLVSLALALFFVFFIPFSPANSVGTIIISDEKIECSTTFSSVGCDVHQIDIRRSLLQTFTLE